MGGLTKENTSAEDESYFLRCACYGHLLNLTAFKEDFGDPDGSFLYLTLYGTDSRYSWANRLKEMWRLFWTGTGGGGEVVLRREEASELGQKIVELSEKLKGKA
jgi:hypothetical protein